MSDLHMDLSLPVENVASKTAQTKSSCRIRRSDLDHPDSWKLGAGLQCWARSMLDACAAGVFLRTRRKLRLGRLSSHDIFLEIARTTAVGHR